MPAPALFQLPSTAWQVLPPVGRADGLGQPTPREGWRWPAPGTGARLRRQTRVFMAPMHKLDRTQTSVCGVNTANYPPCIKSGCRQTPQWHFFIPATPLALALLLLHYPLLLCTLGCTLDVGACTPAPTWCNNTQAAFCLLAWWLVCVVVAYVCECVGMAHVLWF